MRLLASLLSFNFEMIKHIMSYVKLLCGASEAF